MSSSPKPRPIHLTHLILDALRSSTSSAPYQVSQQLTEAYPHKAILEGDSHYFDLQKYVEEGHCQKHFVKTVTMPTGYFANEQTSSVHNHTLTLWDAKKVEIRRQDKNVCYQITWQEQQFMVLILSWPQPYFEFYTYYWILGDNQDSVEAFFGDVCKWNADVRDEVMVFESGYWQKSQELYKSIQNATLDNLILANSLKEDIFEDVKHFFASKEMFEGYNVPWKRGLLLIGPPGNGKTHMVKALINTLGYPCLYIKSFKTRQSTDTENMRNAFRRVREAAPCIVVIEDIDALIDDENRSFFLNELDGFAMNDGVLMIATTNHPERLDMAILERPSRFDRKYHFELPGIEERRAYLQFWNQKLKADMQLSEESVLEVSQAAEGFSFAYLKELLLSASMSWVQTRTAGNMASVVHEQLIKLKSQMESKSSEAPPNGSNAKSAQAQKDDEDTSSANAEDSTKA
jgi:AAA+ superfamily predicted ATPase